MMHSIVRSDAVSEATRASLEPRTIELNTRVQAFSTAAEELTRRMSIRKAKILTFASCCFFAPCTGPYIAYQYCRLPKENTITAPQPQTMR